VNHSDLRRHWEKHLARISVVLWVLAVVVGGFALAQWYSDCALPVITGDLGKAPTDWATIKSSRQDAALHTSQTLISEIWVVLSNVWFSFIAYCYMAAALWVYAAVFVHGVTFAEFLQNLSENRESIRLIWKPALKSELKEIVDRIFFGLVLGFLAAYCMRLQAMYLLSVTQSNVLDFMFSGERRLLQSFVAAGSGSGYASVAAADPATSVTSAITSWIVALYAVLMFFGTVFFVYLGVKNAKKYYLSHLIDKAWRTQIQLQVDEPQALAAVANEVRRDRFLSAVLPDARAYAIIAVGLLASAWKPEFGSLLILTSCYAIWHYWRRSQQSDDL
jgi:hypothetical protein